MTGRSLARSLLACLPLCALAPSALAIDGVYPERGDLRTEVRIEGCPYGPQPEIVNGPRGRALHARWQRDLCAHRNERALTPGWVVPHVEWNASDGDLAPSPEPSEPD